MSYNFESLKENGEGMCISCRKKIPFKHEELYKIVLKMCRELPLC